MAYVEDGSYEVDVSKLKYLNISRFGVYFEGMIDYDKYLELQKISNNRRDDIYHEYKRRCEANEIKGEPDIEYDNLYYNFLENLKEKNSDLYKEKYDNYRAYKEALKKEEIMSLEEMKANGYPFEKNIKKYLGLDVFRISKVEEDGTQVDKYYQRHMVDSSLFQIDYGAGLPVYDKSGNVVGSKPLLPINAYSKSWQIDEIKNELIDYIYQNPDLDVATNNLLRNYIKHEKYLRDNYDDLKEFSDTFNSLRDKIYNIAKSAVPRNSRNVSKLYPFEFKKKIILDFNYASIINNKNRNNRFINDAIALPLPYLKLFYELLKEYDEKFEEGKERLELNIEGYSNGKHKERKRR